MKIKEMKKMPKVSGRVPLLYDRGITALMCDISNAQSKAIDYLYDVVCEQQREIDNLKCSLAAMAAGQEA